MFVGGLRWETTEQSLKEHFKQFGEVTDCVIMKNGMTGQSRGFGFVSFVDPDVLDVVLANEHVVDGKRLDPKRAIPREDTAALNSVSHQQYGPNAPTSKPQTEEDRVFIGGVDNDTKEQQLNEYFSRYGPIKEVNILRDRVTGNARGFGFIKFQNVSSVAACLSGGPKAILNGKEYDVKSVTPQSSSSNRRDGGRYREDYSRPRTGPPRNPGGPMRRENHYNDSPYSSQRGGGRNDRDSSSKSRGGYSNRYADPLMGVLGGTPVTSTGGSGPMARGQPTSQLDIMQALQLIQTLGQQPQGAQQQMRPQPQTYMPTMNTMGQQQPQTVSALGGLPGQQYSVQQQQAYYNSQMALLNMQQYQQQMRPMQQGYGAAALMNPMTSMAQQQTQPSQYYQANMTSLYGQQQPTQAYQNTARRDPRLQ